MRLLGRLFGKKESPVQTLFEKQRRSAPPSVVFECIHCGAINFVIGVDQAA